jgi:hypothetical protein
MEVKKKRIPWNKGLTKEIDERVRRYGEKESLSKRDKEPTENYLEYWNSMKGKKYSVERNKKISETLRRKVKSGEFVPWNLGKTKETHYSVRKISQAKLGKTFEEIAKNVDPNEWKKKTAHYGKENSSWRGGISYYRGKDWYEISKRFRQKNSSCEKCCSKVQVVHHILPYPTSKTHSELMSLCRRCHRSIENRLDKFFKITPRKDWNTPESVETIRRITNKWLVNDIVRTAYKSNKMQKSTEMLARL